MSEFTNEGTQGSAPRKSQSEVLACLKSLTAGQKTALVKIARLYAKATHDSHEDLLQEAYKQVLSGKRTWPSDVAAIPFLHNVMKSIADNWRRKGRKNDQLSEEFELGDEGAGARGMMAKLEVQKVLSIFYDDPVAKQIIVEKLTGATAEELQASLGLSKTEYENKCKKIRRRLEKKRTD